jgi:NAD-dependent deacetylase sirtuin 2
MSQRKSDNAQEEREHIQNTEGDDIEGPGPPDPPTGQERGSSPIDQWVQGLRDDIDEIVAEIVQSDIAEDQDQQRETEEAKVENWTVSKICDELKNERFKNIVVFTGAGISTSAGIPDFRTPGTGLYDNLQAYDLNEPEDIFDLDFFKINPKPFYTLAKEIMPGKFAPTISHHFIAMLEEKGILSRYFTQNIDGLDKIAGVSDEKLIQVHGTFDSNHCSVCNESVNQDLIIEAMQDGEPLQCPRCTISCKTSWIKPDITFFGESLPDKFFEVFNSDALGECDLLIIIGTSLQVSPANKIPIRVPNDCPRLLINREPAGPSQDIWSILTGSEESELNWITDENRISLQSNCRDAFLQSDADDGCLVLAEALGIKKELEERFIDKCKDIQYNFSDLF